MEEEWDYIIIGGGIAGLHIGALLAKVKQKKVVILEKNKILGGRARITNVNGFNFDFGPHPIRFGENSALAKSLKEITNKEWIFTAPKITTTWIEKRKRKRNIKNKIDENNKNGENKEKGELYKTIFPAAGLKSMIKTKLYSKRELISTFIKMYKQFKKDPNSFRKKSIKNFVEENKLSYEMERFLFLVSASMQVNPFIERSSIGELFENFLRVAKNGSIAYPAGGWVEIFNCLQKAIKENDGKILIGTKLEKIEIQNNKINKIITNNGSFKGKNIIITFPIQELGKYINLEEWNSEWAEIFKNLRPTAGIAYDVVLSERIGKDDFIMFEEPPGFGLHVGTLDKDWNKNYGNTDYWSFFCATERNLIESKEKREEFFKKFKNIILKVIPGFEEKIIAQRQLFLNRVDGVEIAIDQNIDNRPKIDLFPNSYIENLYLCGDSIGGEGAGGDIGHTSVRELYKRLTNK